MRLVGPIRSSGQNRDVIAFVVLGGQDRPAAVRDGEKRALTTKWFLDFLCRAVRNQAFSGSHARGRQAAKRGGGSGAWERVTLDEAVAPSGCETVDLVALNDAMDRLAEKKTRLSEVVELRFFGGLSIDETARVLGVSDTTVDNDWFVARAWLARELGGAARS